MLQTYLWIRSDILYGQGRHDELQVLFRAMTSLYPGNEAAKEFLGWHIAFNLKNEAPNPGIAWKWSREGLDILADVPGAYRQVADWFLKQCGQNPVPPMMLRYAGPAWRNELELRERAKAWTKRRWGVELDRFDAGLRALEGHTRFFDQLRRLSLLTFGAYDECVRLGRSDKLKPAADLSRWMANQDLAGGRPPGWREHFEERAWVLEQLADRRVSPRMIGLGRYEVAAALWGLGAHGRNVGLLRAAEAGMQAFARQNDVDCAAEIAAIRSWIVHIDTPGTPQPSLPGGAR